MSSAPATATASATATGTASGRYGVTAPVPTAVDSAGPPVRVRLGAISVTFLDEAALRKTVESDLGKLGACYQQALRKTPKLMGRVTARFAVGAHGKPTGQVKSTNDTQDDELVRRVDRAVLSMVFPKPAGAEATVALPIVLMPGR